MLNILGRSPDHGFDEPLGLLSDCHRRIEHFLELLLKVSDQWQGRALDEHAAEAVHRALKYFAYAAPRHTADEEESLFPRMKAAARARGERTEALERLESDHDRADPLHAQVDRLFNDWLRDGSLAPEGAAELRGVLATLRELYRGHIHVEDAEVFPLAGRLLSHAELQEVGGEMRARRGLITGTQ
jgi:hemerythrin-like domain-containing protein